jgi:hypothetical protein
MLIRALQSWFSKHLPGLVQADVSACRRIDRRIDRRAVESLLTWADIAQATKVRGSTSQRIDGFDALGRMARLGTIVP